MSYRVSCLLLVLCSLLVSSHAKDCKQRNWFENGCTFKGDAKAGHSIDCSSDVVDKVPHIQNDCVTPRAMFLRLKNLTKDAIKNMPPSLKELTIRDSNLKSLPLDIFDDLPNLKTISFRDNHLTTLPERTFKKLHNLKQIDVSTNDLHCDCRLQWIKKSNIDVVGTCASPPSLVNKEINKIPLAVLCDVDECTLGTHDCSFHAACTNTLGSFECTCKSGYRGNGRKCVDFNECSIGGWLCDPKTSTCVNTDGSYQCSCKKGFLKKGRICVDRDECSENVHKCVGGKHRICINTVGSYKCGCQSGYVKRKSSCIDLDECSSEQHNCSIQATCTNVPGGFRCSCNFGYLGNGHFCLETAEASLVKRLMRKNRVFSFLVKRKLVPHALIAVACLLLVIPLSLCLCVCCCKRRRRRRKYKKYKRVPTQEPDEPRTSGRTEAPSSCRRLSINRVPADDMQPAINSGCALAPLPPPPPPPPKSTTSSGSVPPPPPPPPVKRHTNA